MSNCPPDIAVVVVTCEPGGNAEIVSRLADRETPNLSFPVISDPEHKLASTPKEAVFVERMMKASQYATPRTKFVDYQMIQPALLVLDSSGNVEQCWSWRTMGAEKYLDQGDTLESAGVEMVKVDADGNANTLGEQALVTVRPQVQDIFVSIKEGRDVRYGPQIGLLALIGDAIQEQVTQRCCFCFLPKRKKVVNAAAESDAHAVNEDHRQRYEKKCG